MLFSSMFKSIARWLLLVTSLFLILLIVAPSTQAAEIPPAANSFVRTNGPNLDIPHLAVGLISLAKDDGETIVKPGQLLDYKITFSNTSNLTPNPAPAINVTLADSLPLPGYTTFQGCSFDTPFTGSCGLSVNTVNFSLNQPVNPGVTGFVHVRISLNANIPVGSFTNSVSMSYTDPGGSIFAPITAIDKDQVVAGGISAPGAGSPGQPSAPAEVPEADTLVLMASGGAGMMSFLLYELRRRRNKPH